MSDSMKKVRAGQSLAIPASAYNAFIDAALDHRRRTLHLGQATRPSFAQASIVLVRNDSGEARQRFEVLGIDVPIVDPAIHESSFRNRVALSGVAPATGSHAGCFAVLAEPLASGAIGRAFAAGVCPVRIDQPEDARECRFAEIAGGVMTHLVAHPQGSAAILWRAGGTGVQWAVVRLGNASSSHVFPVELSQVGGGAGDDSSPATWTYDLRDVQSGALLAENVNPVSAPHQWRRPESGPVDAASFGYAHFQDNGEGERNLVLGWINELPAPDGDEGAEPGDVEELPPCGHPGNEPGGSSDDDDTEHPGDVSGGSADEGETGHPGDSPSPPSSGECP